MWEQFLKKDLSQKQEASESSPKEDGGQNLLTTFPIPVFFADVCIKLVRK